mgnify:CR=1 FL=1|tara:strand:- start:5295 stop:5762 length:468 start_codon:yes stop_codon:yes gene_type:complete
MKATIYNKAKLNRKVLFKGLEHGYNTYPTDFDMIFNLRNEINIIVDAKEKGKKPVFGQTITYVNISAALQAQGIPSYIVWVEHDHSLDDILLEECLVSLVWHDSTWVTRKQICDKFECDITYGDFQKLILNRHNVGIYNPHKHKFDKKKYLPPTV